MTYPRVSIVTPTLNQAPFLKENILSVSSQKYPNIEHIVVDGGSTDGTIGILKEYDHLIWMSEPDKGQTDAINKGLHLSTGSIWAYLNSDDYYEEGAIWRAVEYLEKNPRVDMIYSNCFILKGARKKKLFTVPFKYGYLLYLKYFIPQPTVFIRKGVLDEVGPFDAELFLTMDLEMWLRVAQNYFIRYVNDFYATFRIHELAKNSNITWRDTIYPKELQKIHTKYRKPTRTPLIVPETYYNLHKKFMRAAGILTRHASSSIYRHK